MKHSSLIQHRLRLIATGLTLALLLAACNTLDSSSDGDLSDANLLALSTDLTEAVPLSATEARSLNGVFADHEQRSEDPGFLWELAASMYDQLDTEQIEKLLEFANRERDCSALEDQGEPFGDGERPGVGPKGRRGPGQGGFGQRGPGGERGEGFLDELLTDDQKEAITAIRETYGPQLRELMQSLRAGDITREEFEEQVTALRETMKAEIDELLTDEQKAAIEEHQAEREAEREARREAEKAAMQEALGLTDAQMTALEELRDEQRAAREEARENWTPGEADPVAFCEARQTNKAEAEAARAEILDERQLAIVKIHRVLASRMARANVREGRRNGEGPGFGGRRG